MADRRHASTGTVRWVAFGNRATGFIAFGNIATGVIAVGNVARGVVAVGNVAVGVIAVGNVAFGMLAGLGATVGIGMVAGGGVLAIPVLSGWAGVADTTDFSPLLGFVPCVLWLLGAMALTGERQPRPEPPRGLRHAHHLDDLGGWVRGKLLETGSHLRARIGRRVMDLEAAPIVRTEVTERIPVGKQAYLRVTWEQRVDEAPGYREAPTVRRVLCCHEALPFPEAPMPWGTAQEVQWWIARGWYVSTVLGLFVAGVASVFQYAG